MDRTILTTQALGLTSSILLSGINIGASLLTLPILYTRPTSISTPFFHEFYDRGAVTLVPLCLFSASCSTLVAYLHPPQRTLWATAGAITVAQLPWTQLFMRETINSLIAIASSTVEQEKASGGEVETLLRRWAWMNIVRGLIAMTGGLTGVWALLEGQK